MSVISIMVTIDREEMRVLSCVEKDKAQDIALEYATGKRIEVMSNQRQGQRKSEMISMF